MIRIPRICALFLLVLATATPAAGCAGALDAAPEPAAAADQARPVALVTGSTRGLGQEVATRLGALGYHVIVHGRNVERGVAVVEAIRAAGGSAEFRRADFLDLAQVRALAEALRRDFDRLALLVNNAGIGSAEDGTQVSVQGYEPVFQVNYLAHFLLTEELLPLLERGAPSRIIHVASVAQYPIDFDDVMLERWEPDGRQIGRPYARSKLAQILHTFDMADRLAPRGITINAVHPAIFMDTYMVRRAGIEPRATVAEGADRVMQLITDDVGTGQYFRDGAPARAHAQAYDETARRLLRELSLRLVARAP